MPSTKEKKPKPKDDGDKKSRKSKRKDESGNGYVGKILMGILAIVVVFVAIALSSVLRPKGLDPPSFPVPPDARPPKCPTALRANSTRDAVSIIIPYLNEEWFRIRATMESILHYTDLSLVREIMWISDGNSPDKVFKSQLQAMHRKVSVFENEQNRGLIRTKMEAAARAKGSMLMFLEPHVLVTPGWLEPLLNRIAEEPQALVMPALDALGEDLKYYRAGYGVWRFEWNLNLVFSNPLNIDVDGLDGPFPSPATSGGIYAIRKDFWDSLEFFDPELVRWGGDHVEASHKVWRCGGRIEVHPCSRVGHWFRSEQVRPYDVKVQSVVRNYKRLAEVWFDDYTGSFYKVKPDAIPVDVGNISGMKERRKRLDCEDMTWYLKNVDVELAWEVDVICVPGAPQGPKYNGCATATPIPRFTSIDKAIPIEEYKRRLAAVHPVTQKGPGRGLGTKY